MKLNIYYSNTQDNCIKQVLSTIKPNLFDEDYVILTPDRRSFITEQELFEKGVPAFFNVKVTTFSRFANDVIGEHNLQNKKVLNKPSAVAIIKKVLLENKEQLKTFNKAVHFNGTASAIFETISMFKSCNINLNIINTLFRNKALNDKINDLKLISEKYNEYLQNDFTDSFNKLNLLSTLISKTNFKNTNFILVGFDDFTPQVYEIITQLIKHSKSVSITTVANFENVNNKNLFLNNVYDNLLDISKLIGVKPNLIACNYKYNKEKEILSKQLFAITKEKTDIVPNLIDIVKFNSKNNEVEFLAKSIIWNIREKNYKFNDFTVIVPNISDYKILIEKHFSKLNIPVFFDTNKSFTDHVLVRFLLNLFDAVNCNFIKDSIVSLLKTIPTLNQEVVFEYQSILEQTGIMGVNALKPLRYETIAVSDELKNLYEFFNPILRFNLLTKKEHSVYDFVCLLEEFLNEINFNGFIEYYLNYYKESNNILEYKFTSQINSKIQTALNDLKELFSDYVCSFSAFTEIAESYFSNISLSIPPIELDTVFIADSVNSYITDNKIIFCLGANSGVLPVQLNDLGIITDSEINQLKPFANLSPTVAFINKRNKILLYEKLLKAQEKLFISYLTVNEKNEQLMESSFVNDIISSFNFNNIYVGEVLLNKGGGYGEVKDYYNRILFNNPNFNVAVNNFINLLKDWYFYFENLGYLQQVSLLKQALDEKTLEFIKNLNYKNSYDIIENAKELFFKNNTISVSQLESFFACPFEHFVKYGLKLHESETSDVTAIEFGNILHEYTSLILPIISKKEITINEVEENVKQVFDYVISKPEYEIIVNNPLNKNTLKSLLKEAEFIAKAMIYEQQVSNFVPTKFESRFGTNATDAVKIETNKGEIYLQGVIDRVDYFNNAYRIIDYKTGEAEFNNFTEIVSGKKLQLFIYVKAEKTQQNVCVGAFYLPLKDAYLKGNKNLYELFRLKGVIANDSEIIYAMDNTLREPLTKSYVVNIETKKDGSFGKRGSNLVISQDDIMWIANYAIELLRQAYLKIITGDITPQPLKITNDLNYNKPNLIGMNNFNLEFGNKFRKVNKVSVFNKEEFINELNKFVDDQSLVYNINLELVKKDKEQ